MMRRSTTSRVHSMDANPSRDSNVEKYRGNRINYLNSVAIVETDSEHGNLRYAVIVLSNVLRKDSSEQHKALAAKINELIQSLHPAPTSDASP